MTPDCTRMSCGVMNVLHMSILPQALPSLFLGGLSSSSCNYVLYLLCWSHECALTISTFGPKSNAHIFHTCPTTVRLSGFINPACEPHEKQVK